MPLDAAILPAIIETVIARLIPLFLAGAGNDPAAAREGVLQIIANQAPADETELLLIAQIIVTSLHSMDAGNLVGDPAIPPEHRARIANAAVRLTGDSLRLRARLERYRKARDSGQTPPIPKIESRRAKADIALVQDAIAAKTPARPGDGPTWTDRYKQRQRERNLAARAERDRQRLETAKAAAARDAAREARWAAASEAAASPAPP